MGAVTRHTPVLDPMKTGCARHRRRWRRSHGCSHTSHTCVRSHEDWLRASQEKVEKEPWVQSHVTHTCVRSHEDWLRASQEKVEKEPWVQSHVTHLC